MRLESYPLEVRRWRITDEAEVSIRSARELTRTARDASVTTFIRTRTETEYSLLFEQPVAGHAVTFFKFKYQQIAPRIPGGFIFDSNLVILNTLQQLEEAIYKSYPTDRKLGNFK